MTARDDAEELRAALLELRDALLDALGLPRLAAWLAGKAPRPPE